MPLRHRSLTGRFAALLGALGVASLAVGWTAASRPSAVASALLQPEEPPSPPFKSIEVANEPGEVRITLDDERSFRGILMRQDEVEVVIRIAGIETPFDAREVREITPLKLFDEVYAAIKTQIPAEDYDTRYDFCEWIFRRDRLPLAVEELEALLADHPRHEEARTLMRAALREIDAREQRAAGDPRGSNENQRGNQWYGPTSLISDENVNLIRVFEIDLQDPPRMLIPRATVDRLLDRYAGQDSLPTSDAGRKRFHYKPDTEILETMFRLQARDLYGEVQVLSEPKSLNRFRLDVHRTWLINSCATDRCHGGAEAGELFLFNRRAHDANTVYSNLLILERTRIDGEPLINYEDPAASMLLQLGLPPSRTIRPHPPTPGWRPVFRDQEDPLYQKAVRWIRSMYQPRPKYPIDFVPPAQRRDPTEDATEKTTEPATGGTPDEAEESRPDR